MQVRVVFAGTISDNGDNIQLDSITKTVMTLEEANVPGYDTILRSRFSGVVSHPSKYIIVSPIRREVSTQIGWGIPAMMAASVPLLMGWPYNIAKCQIKLKATLLDANTEKQKEYVSEESAWASTAVFWGYALIENRSGKAACSDAIARAADSLYDLIVADGVQR